jgi:hypothetical protein
MADADATELRPQDRIDEPTVREHRANSDHCNLTGDCMAEVDSTTLPAPIPTPLNVPPASLILESSNRGEG